MIGQRFSIAQNVSIKIVMDNFRKVHCSHADRYVSCRVLEPMLSWAVPQDERRTRSADHRTPRNRIDDSQRDVSGE
jgi:hypothetical protein